LLNYFSLKLVVYDIVAKECNEKIAKTVADPEESISSYLAKIAAQKNVVISHDVYGNVIFFRPDVKAKPKAFYTAENTETMSFEVNGQGMHSSINTLRQPSKKQKGSSTLSPVDSLKNPLVLANRPTLDVLTSGADTDTLKGAKNSLATELKNITLNLSFKQWEAISIGDIIEAQNKELYLNKRTRFMVAETTIGESAEDKIMSVKCVLPETFTGETPKNIFA
jgi:prophage tail gpP-like protein